LRLRNRDWRRHANLCRCALKKSANASPKILHDETLPALSSVARMADRLSQELTDNPVPNLMRTNWTTPWLKCGA